jgi:TonB family protein
MARFHVACVLMIALLSGVAHARQTPQSEESPAVLQQQLEQILMAAQDRNSQRFESLVSDLQIPDDANWFASTFGEGIGERLAARYKNSWADYDDHLTSAFRGFKAKKEPRLEIEDLSADDKDPTVHSVLQDAKAPFHLYAASIESGTRSVLPGMYVYVQGAFRVLYWSALYGLPNVKPMRIRIGGQVAQANVVYQVPPRYPDDAKQMHIHGTVVLHAIIGRDGDIEELQSISGPSELRESAMSAVKQWRYKPTLLNGDPVEVDTTISVVYTLGR